MFDRITDSMKARSAAVLLSQKLIGRKVWVK